MNFILFITSSQLLLGDAMSEDEEFDPLFSPIRKSLKIHEFLVLDKEEEGIANYIIKEFNSSKILKLEFEDACKEFQINLPK